MHLQLLLTDSEISFVEQQPRVLLIHFSAASVIRSSSEAEAMAGHSTGLVLQLNQFLIHDTSEPLIGRIHHGTLWIDGQVQLSCAVPYTCTQAIKLELELANEAYLLVTGNGLKVSFESEPNFYESLAC